MVIGLLQFDLIIHGAESIKDKRRVVSSVKDRLHREHMVSLAEIGNPDLLNLARMALVTVARDGKRVGEVLDHVSEKLRSLRDGEVAEISRSIVHGSEVESDEDPTILNPDPDGSLAAEMMRRSAES